MKKKIGFAGAGFACAVLARELVSSGNFNATVFETRDHVAGNCHTSRDKGIMVHHYGPHIFNTSRKDVWDYVNNYEEFRNFTNRVKAVTSKGVFSLPINLLTINQFFGKKLNPSQAELFIKDLGDKNINDPQNFEEQALSMLGRELYEAFFYGYTKKQWGVEPSELPASILKRLPIRFNYDDNYYQQLYQGIPVNGYTKLIENILDHPDINIVKNTKLTRETIKEFDHVFYSGTIDEFFDYTEGELAYRTLKFERFDHKGDFQGNPVINYCEESVPYTRISEHKHFAPWETHEESICFKEYSFLATRTDNPYYPLRLKNDKDVLGKYVALANQTPSLTFIGRLGTYRYLDMHVVIGESLDLAKRCLNEPLDLWPSFSVDPLG
jgi:UDP-galactopyranose mutase